MRTTCFRCPHSRRYITLENRNSSGVGQLHVSANGTGTGQFQTNKQSTKKGKKKKEKEKRKNKGEKKKCEYTSRNESSTHECVQTGQGRGGTLMDDQGLLHQEGGFS